VAEQILELFPLEELPPKTIEELKQEQVLPHLKQIQQDLISQRPRPVEEEENGDIRRPGELYRRYRTVEDLPENARAFYEKAGKSVQLGRLMGSANLT
jgi:RNA polymerase I-specific transcription initiation factor RRN7